jgi:PAS domain-containing protein
VIGAERTLLSYLDAPVVIGDPDGCAVYANPAFELRFERAVGRVPGAPLAELFEGGAREAVLRAVVVAAAEGESVRFRLREGAQGFSAVASPIASGGESVGVVILLKEEVEGLERVLALHRTMEQPMDELGQVVQQLFELPVVAREARLRALLGDAQQALGRLRKGADEVHAVLTGSRDAADGVPSQGAGAAPRRFDPSGLLHRVAARAERSDGAEGRSIEVVVAPGLPMLPGDPHRVEALLLRLLERRLAPGAALEHLVITARQVAGAAGQGLLVSLCELGAGACDTSTPDPPHLREEAAALGAELRSVAQAGLGRATVLRLRLPR